MNINAEQLKERIRILGSEQSVEFTADRLERMHWTPELFEEIRDFSRITRVQLIEEVDRFLSMSDEEIKLRFADLDMTPERIRLTGASLLVNAGELLWKLRADIPEAWDYVNELYEDD